MAKQYRTALIIEGDAKGGIRAIQATDKELNQLNRRFDDGGKRAKQLSRDVDGISRELEFLKNSALGVGAALAGAFAVSNLAGQAKMIQQTDALARSLNVNTQTLQQWQYAGQQVGLEADKMGDIFKDVSDKIGDFAATGGGEAADLFENLNLNIRELQSLTPDQQILKIAEAVNQLEDPSQRTFYFESLADEMVRLQPLLEDGARGLRESAAEADALGVAMDKVEVTRAVEAAHAMEQLQGVAAGLSNTLISDLGPGLADATGNLTTLIQQAGGVGEVLEDVATIAGTLATVYLARRLGPGLLRVGKTGLAAGGQIAQGMVIATGASGRLNQALVVTQGRIAATAAAGRALNGTMSLLGGPAGVAILAAGALYTYREELGFVDPLADAADESIRGLAAAIRDGDKAALDSSFETLSLELESVSLEAQNAMLHLQELEARQGFYDKSHGGISNSLAGEISSQNQHMADLWARQAELMENLDKIRKRREELANAGGGGDDDEESTLKSLIKTYDEQHAKLVELRQAREAISQAMADDPQNAAQYRRMLGEVDKQIEQLTETTKADSAAKREAEKAAKEQAASLEQLRQAMDPLRSEHQEYIERIGVLNKALEEGTIGETEYGEAVRWAAEQYTDAATGAEDYEKRTKELVQQYDASAQKAQALEQAVADLNQRYRDGSLKGGPEQYQRILAAIHEEQQRLALESDPMAQEMARAWEEAANRIDETFADAFTGAFDSFEDFGDALLGGFQRLLGELAYQATLKPIVVQFTGQMKSAMGIEGGAAQQGGGSLMDMASTGKDLYSLGSKAWDAGATWLAGGQAAQTASSVAATGGLYGAATTSGLYASAATGGTIGAGTAATGGMMSGAMGAVGTAMPYIGAAMAVDNLLDLGIVDGIVDGISGLFGGFSGVDPNLVFKSENQGREQGRTGWEHGVYSEGALGAVGFDPSSRDLDYAFDSFEEAQQFTDQVAQLDNVFAQAAGSAEQLATMQDAVFSQGVMDRSPQEFLEQRYRTAFDAVNSRFEDLVMGIEGDAQGFVSAAVAVSQVEPLLGNFSTEVQNEVVARVSGSADEIVESAGRMATSLQALSVLDASAERLGLQIDTTSTKAIDAAYSMQELAGGVENLASLQQQYYDTWTTDEQKLANLRTDLTEQLASVGIDALPQSAAGVRDLVGSLDTMTEAGREQLVTLYQLTPSLKQFTAAMNEQRSAAEEAAEAISNERWSLQNELLKAQGKDTELLNRQRERELAGLDESNRALQERIWALEDATAADAAAAEEAQRRAQLAAEMQLYSSGAVDGAEDALASYNAAMTAAAEYADQQQQLMESLRDAMQTVSQLADDLLLSDRSILDPLERLDEAQRQWVEQSVRAETDPNAASNLGQSGDDYLEALAAAYGQSSAEYAQGMLDVEDTYRSLEDLYGEQLDTLGSQESIARQQLREEQRATAALRDQLSSLGKIGDLLGDLPTTLAQAIAEALPGYDPGSVGSGGGGLVSEDAFDTAAYLYNKTQQVNANAQGGRTDWTIDQVRERIEQDYGSVYQHYAQVGASEGVSPSYDGDDKSSGASFDADLYIARKREQLNKSAAQGKTDWTTDEVWAAFAESGLTPWEHSQLYGATEGIDGYHRDGLDRVPHDGYRAVLHADEMVLTRDIADTVRAGMQSLDAARSLPPAIVPPAFGGGSQAAGGQDLTALVQAVNRLSDDNAQLRGQIDALIAATGVVIDNTGAVIEPAARTAEAAEGTNRAMRTRERSTT